jgi:hypothetical protein
MENEIPRFCLHLFFFFLQRCRIKEITLECCVSFLFDLSIIPLWAPLSEAHPVINARSFTVIEQLKVARLQQMLLCSYVRKEQFGFSQNVTKIV